MIMTTDSILTSPTLVDSNNNDGMKENKECATNVDKKGVVMVEELWKQNFETIKLFESASLIDLSDSNHNVSADMVNEDVKGDVGSEEGNTQPQTLTVIERDNFSECAGENALSTGRDSPLSLPMTDVGRLVDSGVSLIDSDTLAKHDLDLVNAVQKSFRAYVKGFSENVSKRMDQMQELIYDFMDEPRAYAKRQMVNKSTQTDTSISCQGLSSYLTKKAGGNSSAAVNLLRPVSPQKDQNVVDANNKYEEKSILRSESTRSSSKDEKSGGSSEKTTLTSKASTVQRSVWLAKNNIKNGSASDEEVNESADDSTEVKTVLRTEMDNSTTKSSTETLPWHDTINNKEWIERQIMLEEQKRKVNNLLNEHLKKKPARAPAEQKPATVFYSPAASQKALQFADDCEPPPETRQTIENNRFFDRLEHEYMLPPHPRAQLNEQFLDFRRSRRNAPSGRYYTSDRSSNFIQPQPLNSVGPLTGHQIRNASTMSFNMAARPRRDDSQFTYNSPQKPQNAFQQYRPQQQQGDFRHRRSASHPHNHVRMQSTNNYPRGPTNLKTMSSALPPQQLGRHERRFVEAQKMNVKKGRLMTPNKAMLSSKVWTKRGNGVFTSDDEESFVNSRLDLEEGEVLSD